MSDEPSNTGGGDDDGPRGGPGRLKTSWPPSPLDIDPFDTSENIAGQLDHMRKIGDAARNERWANVRQLLTIVTFIIGLIGILAALCFSGFILLTRGPDPVDLSKWILETLLGALVAGLIGFWAVKSFEK